MALHDVAQVQFVERFGMLGEFIRPIRGTGHAAELFGSFYLFKGMDEHVIGDVLLAELDPAHLFFALPRCSVPVGKDVCGTVSPGPCDAGPGGTGMSCPHSMTGATGTAPFRSALRHRLAYKVRAAALP